MILASGPELIDTGYCSTLYSPLKLEGTDFQLKKWSLKKLGFLIFCYKRAETTG
jgi:hypothetical protein